MQILPIWILLLVLASIALCFLPTLLSKYFIKFAEASAVKQRLPKNINNLVNLRGRRKSKTITRGITVAATIAAAVIAGHGVSAQLVVAETSPPFPSLKSVPVPEPKNIEKFIKDKTAAIALGKALFWDMQVGSDGITSCASCHFHAGADNRSKNQISPGLLIVNASRQRTPDTVATKGMNYQLKPEDFPIPKEINDVVSSQGVFNSEFVDVVPGNAEDKVNYKPDQDGFQVGDINVRRVEPRNSPSVINSVFNFRNFWDGRAQNEFNGVNPFGSRDPNAKVYRAKNPGSPLEPVKLEKELALDDSSLASVAVGPPLSAFEMSADGRTFQEIGDKISLDDKKIHSVGKGKKLQRQFGKKVLPLRPLAKQKVHPDDSVLGAYSRAKKDGLPGLVTASYEKMIEAAFQSEWWKSNWMIEINADGSRTPIKKAGPNSTTQKYTLMEYNFPLFFGLSVQSYLATLVADDTPFDRYLEGTTTALTASQQRGFEIFQTKGKCINCHGGSELTNASVSSVEEEPLDRMEGSAAIYDTGFNNTGVRPSLDDLAVGDVDPWGNPLSLSRLAQRDGSISANEPVVADGGFKVPGLRNIELTAPYMHNGGMLTLEQVVEFYNRGGDFDNGADLDPDIQNLGLTPEEKQDLVAFLKGLTDERVRYDKAPFDHPQLFIPNGHPGDTTSVTNDGTGKATDTLIEIPAVGSNGMSVLRPNFLETAAAANVTPAPQSTSNSNPLEGRITQEDCPAGSTLQFVAGGYACMAE